MRRHAIGSPLSFLDPDAFQEMQVETKGEFHGLGVDHQGRLEIPTRVPDPGRTKTGRG